MTARRFTDLVTEAETEAHARSNASRVYLVVSIGAAAPKVFELREGVDFTIGRADEATIVVADARVSRLHARFSVSGDQITVRDLGSRNGTKVGEATIVDAATGIEGGESVFVGPAAISVSRVEVPRPIDESSSKDGFSAPSGIVVSDPAMKRLYTLVRRVAKMSTSVLIYGETGVGKEAIGEAIHAAGPRADGPLVRLSCASIPESLLESELFGYERGAFTGADKRKIGFVEAAAGGTLFLDEIGEMPLSTQTKLLRVLEQRRVTRLGSTQELPVDVRFVSATHRDLSANTNDGRFRADLYYRLAGFTLVVPPLRERPSEIILLAKRFLDAMAERTEEPAPVLSPQAARALLSHPWPGNVRELRNVIEHAFVVAEGEAIGLEHLPLEQESTTPTSGPLRSTLADEERRRIDAALKIESGNQTRAALRLGISRRALIHKMVKYGMPRTRAR